MDASPKTELDKIYDSLYQMRYGGAMDEGEDLRTILICVTNRLLDLMDYMGERDEGERSDNN